MSTTKLFYQEPIGGNSAYEKAMNQCVTVYDAMSMPAIESNAEHGCVWLSAGDKEEDNRYLRFTDVYGCSYKVELIPMGAESYWVEGQTAIFSRKIYNPFNYKLNSPSINVYETFTSIPPYPAFSIPAVSNINANSSTTFSTITITVPSPEIIYDSIANMLDLLFNAMGDDPTGTLLTSGNTDMSKNIKAYPVPYWSSNCPLARPILTRPYIVLTRVGSGNVNSGATVTIYCDIYNRNDGKTSASGGSYNVQKVKARLTLSGSGFSGNAGTIAYSGGSSTTYVEATGITINRTTNQLNPSYTRVTFTYTAPSSTTQGTVTITPSVTDWYYGSNDAFTSYPGTGNTVQITVNPSVQMYYFPFKIITENGTYLTRSNIENYADDPSGLVFDIPDIDGESHDYVPFSYWETLQGYDTVWYLPTTFPDTMYPTAASSCDSMEYEDWDSEYSIPSTISYSAFVQAGLYDFLITSGGCAVAGCGFDADIYFEWDSVTLSFTASQEVGTNAMPLDSQNRLQHLYFKIQLIYQNSSYNSGKSRTRTLVYDFSKMVYDSTMDTWESGSIGSTYNTSDYVACSTGPVAISDTWNTYNLTDADFMYGDGSSNYGAAYISYIGISSNNSTYSDLSLEGVCQTLYSRCWGIGGYSDIYDSFNMDNMNSPYTYMWNSLCGSLTNLCSAGGDVVVCEELQCNVCGTSFCNCEYPSCPICGEESDLTFTGNSC